MREIERGTTTQLGQWALDCVLSCEAKLLALDDLHFLKWNEKNGIEVSNHLKWIANEFPVTLLLIGVGLADKGLFSEGDACRDAALAQTGRRTTRLGMRPFTIDSEEGRQEWRAMLLALEQRVVLCRQAPRNAGGRTVRLPLRPQHRAHRLSHDTDQPRLSAGRAHRCRAAQPRPAGPGPKRRGVRGSSPRTRSSPGKAAADQPTAITSARSRMTDTVRTLPIRLTPLPGEALDSWLEALATRMSTPFGNVVTAVGLSASAYGVPRWAMMLKPGEAEQIATATATGTDAEQITSMTLQRWDGQALVIDPVRRIGHPQVMWSGPRGSRFCPACLAESGNRWPVVWRLTWSFACTRHHVLLADRCPECGRSPRSRFHQLSEVPRPGLCSTPAPKAASHGRRCHHAYTATTVLPIEPGGQMERAQQFIDALLLTSAADTSMPLYGETAPTVFQLLSDIKALASMVLNYSILRDLSTWCPSEVATRLDNYRVTPLPRSQRRSQRADRHSTYAPTDAAATAVGVTAAMRILQAGDVRAVGDAARWLTDRVAASGRGPYPASYAHWGGGLSPALTASLRCSREHHLLCGHPGPGRHRDRPRRLRTARHPYQPPRLHGRPPCPHTARRLLGRPRLSHRLRPSPGRLRLPQHLHRPEAVAKAARAPALQPRMFSCPRSAVALPQPYRHSTALGPLRYQPSASPVSAVLLAAPIAKGNVAGSLREVKRTPSTDCSRSASRGSAVLPRRVDDVALMVRPPWPCELSLGWGRQRVSAAAERPARLPSTEPAVRPEPPG